MHADSRAELLWVFFGLFGQLMFTGRFLVQWIASEKAKRSVVPVMFWYFSLAGGVILLAYAIYRKDPVFVLGQSLGVFIYLRNLWLIRKAEAPA
ncbi:MAG: lipid-A-disaccharide synthase N-terminal domain-containing protein [Paracoccaceae bacterium]